MKKTLIIFSIAAIVFACNTTSNEKQSIKEVTLTEFEEMAADLSDATIEIEGLVTHVCKHGGQKMFITDEGKEISLLVRVSNSIPEFDVALEGSKVKVTGKVIASVVEPIEGSGEGEMHMEENADAKAEPKDCPTEEAMKEGDACKTDITYHVEAIAFKEL